MSAGGHGGAAAVTALGRIAAAREGAGHPHGGKTAPGGGRDEPNGAGGRRSGRTRDRNRGQRDRRGCGPRSKGTEGCWDKGQKDREYRDREEKGPEGHQDRVWRDQAPTPGQAGLWLGESGGSAGSADSSPVPGELRCRGHRGVPEASEGGGGGTP